jgi:hypothetical protein
VQTGDADGISYILTENDPFAAIDLDHCRDAGTHSIDVWAQNFLDTGRDSYSEVTPSGTGCRIWGLADGSPLHKKFSLEIDNKAVAVELFRRTNKALTITGYKLDTIRELTNIDWVIDWGIKWGERRKAAAIEAAVKAAPPSNSNGLDGGGCKYSIEHIEEIVRTGAPAGANRSDVFHAIIGHYLGCGWSAEQIHNHMQQFPDGICSRYLREERLAGEIARSASKYAARTLPLFEPNGGWINGWAAKVPEPQIPAQPEEKKEPERDKQGPESDKEEPEIDDHKPVDELDEDHVDGDDLDDHDLGGDDDLDDEPPHDPKLPPLYAHGDADPRPLKNWLVKHLIPACGHGLLSGQWGAGKTFVVFDLFAALATGQPFLGNAVKRQCGVLLIAAEGADEVRLRLDAVVRAKCGNMARAPVRWYETAPMLLHKGSVETMIAMARQAEDSLQQEFGLPLGLIVVDTIAACAGYARAGDENDPAAGQAVMNTLKALAQAIGCFVLGVDHFGKSIEAGTRGASSKESAADLVLACLGDKGSGGNVADTKLAVRKNRGGRQGQEYPFELRIVEAPEPDEDGDAITTMVVDWLPPGAQRAAPPPPEPWLEGCRQEDQRVGMSRLKRVLTTALAEHGVELPIPDALQRRNSSAPIGDELRTPVASDPAATSPLRVPTSPLLGGDEVRMPSGDVPIPDATRVRSSGVSIGDELRAPVASGPVVRMVDQETVRKAFYLCTPADPRQTQRSRFERARDRAEQRGLIQAGNVDEVTYLWLTRPAARDEEEPDVVLPEQVAQHRLAGLPTQEGTDV